MCSGKRKMKRSNKLIDFVTFHSEFCNDISSLENYTCLSYKPL